MRSLALKGAVCGQGLGQGSEPEQRSSCRGGAARACCPGLPCPPLYQAGSVSGDSGPEQGDVSRLPHRTTPGRPDCGRSMTGGRVTVRDGRPS